MAFVYSSNSPEFLNYVASCKTRNDIKNDPRLCVLLEDPHIKDNMELALLYRAAQYGDYEAKKEFVGFFLANGPELDTDTLMFFREKIIHSPVYMEIYKHEYYNIASVDTLRIEKYNKNTTDSDDKMNCLLNPCEYLGPFSSSIGLMGDDKNFNTLSNVFSRITFNKGEEKKKEEESKDKKDDKKKEESKDKKDDKKEEETKDKEVDNSTTTWGNIRQHVISKIVPDIEKAYRTMLGNMALSFDDFSKKLSDKNLSKEVATVGDNKAEEKAKDIAAAVKVNVVSNLGDCARIWENMRRLRVYDPSKNAKKPFSNTISKKTPDGNPVSTYTPQTDTALKPKQPVAIVGGKGKTWVKNS